MRFNDGHIDGIGQAVVGLSLVMLLVLVLTWPLGMEHTSSGPMGNGGCHSESCSSTQ